MKATIDKFNSSVGVYSTHSIDEIGGYKQETYTIVDSGMEEEAEIVVLVALVQHTDACAYEEVVSAKLVHYFKTDSIAKQYGASDRVITSNYNMIYSDGRSYYFTTTG